MARSRAGLALLVVALALPSAASAAPPVAGTLTPLPGLSGCFSNDGTGGQCTDAFGLGGAYDIAASPDGANVYVAGYNGYVAVFRRDPATGALSETQCFSFDGTDTGGGSCTNARAIGGPNSVAVSPDDRFVYVGSDSANGEIAIFSRDTATGALTQLPGSAGCFSNSGASSDDGPGTCGQGRGFSYLYQLAISADGRELYAGDEAGGGVAVLRRDISTGELSQSAGLDGCISSDGTATGGGSCADERAMYQVEGLALSPDGRQLYVGDLNAELAVLQRDPATGNLSQSSGTDGCLSEDGNAHGGPAGSCTQVIALGDIYHLTVAPDGRSVYTTGYTPDEVANFSRDPSTGALGQQAATACVSDTGAASASGSPISGACADGRGLDGAYPVTVSPAGDSVYVGGYDGAEMASFARDLGSGGLTQLSGQSGCFSASGDDAAPGGNGLCSVAPAFVNPTGIAISPDGTSVYVSDASGNSVSAFRREAAPVCQSQTVAVQHATATPLTLHCSDPNGDPLTISVVLPPGSGSLGAIAPDGSATYTPAAGFGGLTSFTFAATDGTNRSPLATVALQVQADHTRPALSRVGLLHAVFRVGKVRTPLVAAARRHPIGTAFAFTLSEPARVAIAIQRALPGRRVGHACRKPSARLRHRRACTRYVRAGTLSRSGKQGRNRVKFSGRLGRRALKPGRYRARLVATDPSGNRSKPRTLKFRVVKR